MLSHPPDYTQTGPATYAHAMPNAVRAKQNRNGKYVAIAMIVLWLAILIAVYIVIVPLKLGGEEGIMREKPSAIETPVSSE